MVGRAGRRYRRRKIWRRCSGGGHVRDVAGRLAMADSPFGNCAHLAEEAKRQKRRLSKSGMQTMRQESRGEMEGCVVTRYSDGNLAVVYLEYPRNEVRGYSSLSSKSQIKQMGVGGNVFISSGMAEVKRNDGDYYCRTVRGAPRYLQRSEKHEGTPVEDGCNLLSRMGTPPRKPYCHAVRHNDVST